jgi:hypothetical protein
MNPTLEREDMRYWRMQPDELLRPWVICYFLVEPKGRSPAGERVSPESQQQLLLPDGYSEIVFSLDAAFERWSIGQPDERAVMSSSYLIGGRSHSVLTRNLGAVRLAGAKLDSRLLRAVIGIPLNEFRDSTLTLSEINARPLLDLDESIQGVRSPEDIKADLDRFFLRTLGAASPEDPVVGELLEKDSTQSRHPFHHEVVACRAHRFADTGTPFLHLHGNDAQAICAHRALQAQLPSPDVCRTGHRGPWNTSGSVLRPVSLHS